jgi:transcriptional regulator
MKYPPKIHQETDLQHSIATINRFPLATLISVKETEIFTSHVPLIYEASQGKFGSLIGHIDAFNPHVALLQNEIPAQAIFHGPDCYISPTIYSTTQLPTWNYVKVHITGKVTRITDDEAVIDSLDKMTNFLETTANPYVLDTDHPRVRSLTNYIVGFRLEITNWEGKFKLSQNRNPKDRNLAKEALIQESRKDITAFLDNIV